jgi:type I restriction enzyme, S subunit
MLNDTNASWPLKPLSEVVDLNPRVDKSAYRDDLEVSFVPMAAVEAGSGRMEVSQTKHFSSVKKGYTPFKESDVLFAKITPCMENGKMAVVPKLTSGLGFGSTEFHVLRPREGMDPRFVYYFVSSQDFRREAAHRMTGAVGQKRVPKSFLEETLIPVPLLEDQKGVVAEIEKQFSRLDEAVANLKRVKANLKRYKASVLKAAVEGKLTEEWRKQHPNVEPASKLLERILAERRTKWNGRGKYKEPAKPDTNNFPSLPEKWTWATVDQLTAMVTSGSRGWGEYYSHTGPLFIRAQDIKTDSLNLQTIARVSIPNNAEGMRTAVTKGDILITITGANVTKSALVKQLGEQAFVSQHVALLKPSLASVSTYLFTWVVSPEHGRKMLERWAYGAGKPGLSLNQVRGLPVALPPLAEQNPITAEVERRQSLIEELEVAVEANLIRADRLRRSTLTAAFSGRLL